MAFRTLISAVVAALAPPAAARAEPLFDLFQKVCVESHGQPAAALATADKLAWNAMSDADLKDQAKSNPILNDMVNLGGRIQADGAPRAMLTVGNLKNDGYAELCVFVSPDSDLAALKAAASDYAKVPETHGFMSEGVPAFVWREEAGVHRAVTESEFKSLRVNSGVRMLSVGETSDHFKLIMMMAPGAAPAGGANAAFETFDQLCLKTRAMKTQALQLADASGWEAIPERRKASVAHNQSLRDIEGRSKRTDLGDLILAAGVSEAFVEAKSVPMRGCIVGVLPGDPDIAGRLRAWAGVPSDLVGGNVKAGYTFADEGGVHRALTPHQKDSLATYKSGHLVSVTLEEDGDALVLVLAIPNFEPSH